MSDHPPRTATSSPGKGGVFVTTRWTAVLAARGATPEAKAALSELCAAYWAPVFRFLRSEGRDEDTARELTQEFFARILAREGFANAAPERGRFRSFLLGAVKHFLGDLRDRERAAKRGGGPAPESIHGGDETETGAGIQIADPAAHISDTYFDQQLAFALMERAFVQLSDEWTVAGKLAQFTALKPWLIGDCIALSQGAAARTLGLSEGAVKVSIHRLRKRFRELIRAEVAQTVPQKADAEEELRYLVDILATR
jgi:RNA polymerase sigma-70 factor (ECF subfamily)